MSKGATGWGWGAEIWHGEVFGVGLPYAMLKIPFQLALFTMLFGYTLYGKFRDNFRDIW